MFSTTRRTAVRTILPVASILAAVGVLAILTPTALFGQSENEVPPRGDGPQTRHPEAAEAIGQLWSPYCPGLMLEVCPSGGGAALRDSLQQLAEEGKSSEELVEWVLDNHGEEYRAMPKREGAALLAWVAPPAAVVLGLGIVILVLWRMRKARRAEAPSHTAAGEPSDEEERRLREAMRELDEEEDVSFF